MIILLRHPPTDSATWVSSRDASASKKWPKSWFFPNWLSLIFQYPEILIFEFRVGDDVFWDLKDVPRRVSSKRRVGFQRCTATANCWYFSPQTFKKTASKICRITPAAVFTMTKLSLKHKAFSYWTIPWWCLQDQNNNPRKQEEMLWRILKIGVPIADNNTTPPEITNVMLCLPGGHHNRDPYQRKDRFRIIVVLTMWQINLNHT